jgi:phosphate acetyltransferase
MKKATELIWERARAQVQHIVLPEGGDPRTIKAAAKIVAEKLARVTVVGQPATVAKLAQQQGVTTAGWEVVDPLTSPLTAQFAADFVAMRKGKQELSLDDARKIISEEMHFGAMMVHKGLCDGFVSGAAHATADVCRAVFRVIGISPQVKIASSFSLMQLPAFDFGVGGALIYADTGTVINPNAEQLADIAVATASVAWALLGVRPKIAMISCSTKGSAKDPSIDKVIQATALAKARIAELKIEADVDGEMQGDAALIPAICASKAKGSPIEGRANVLVFPDLNCGNTCYKLTERLAGAVALGPVFMGLKKPASDLSRGCSADDIVGIAAIVACQAIGQKAKA